MACWRPLPGALRCASLHLPARRGSGALQPLLRQALGGRCLATEAAAEPATASDWRKTALTATVAIAGLGGAAWAVAPWFWSADSTRILEGPDRGIDTGRGVVKPISDDIFDHEDNLFVFFLDQPEDILGRSDDIDRILKPLLGEDSLRRLRFFHNVRNEGDPAVPKGEGADEASEEAKKPLKVVMYKGQRKVVINVGEEVPVKQIVDFYTPVSEVLSATAGQQNKELLVPRVSGNAFRDEVVMASSPTKWVLVQMYEDSCFLCFLMRPFVNSVAVLLKEHDMPVSIKRLNVQENDFPDLCPIARGTPTFVLYRGPKAAGMKWDEFKPKDLVDKLTKELPQMDESVYTKMEEYQELVSNRFRLFTQMVFWTVELSKIQTLVTAPPASAGAVSDAGAKPKDNEESDFNGVVAHMMSRDMKRTDGIHENLKHLQTEVDEVEHDCAVLGMMLGETVLERERQMAAA